jgi:hypothetical protein
VIQVHGALVFLQIGFGIESFTAIPTSVFPIHWTSLCRPSPGRSSNLSGRLVLWTWKS